MDERRQRVLRQHLRTDQLLGIEQVPAGDAAANPPKPARFDRDQKLQVLRQLDETEVRPCTRCELSAGRIQTVFGDGDPDADVMFVGEGPGKNEDEQGRPFVGRAGELLNNMIKAMGYTREKVYIANIVKCRPPENRAPTAMEIGACAGFLKRQILTINPKVIVTLGGPAVKALLGKKEGVTRLRGTWHQFCPEAGGAAIPVMPTFHPAYLLRAYTKENREKVWSDLQEVMVRVGQA